MGSQSIKAFSSKLQVPQTAITVSSCGAFLAPNMKKYLDKTSFLFFKSEVYSETQWSNFLHSHTLS